jgi:Spy/CpxP family protein refolding chaperone
MKRILMAILVAGAIAAMASAQCPGMGQQPGGQMMEKKEIMIKMGPEGQPGMAMGRGQWWENPMAVKELGLTDDQAQKIDDLSLKHRKENIKAQADMKVAQIELQDLIENQASDSDIRKKSKEVFQLRERMHDAKIEHMLAIRKLLTPEQQKKLKGLKTMMRHHMGMGQCGTGQCDMGQGQDCCPGSGK